MTDEHEGPKFVEISPGVDEDEFGIALIKHKREGGDKPARVDFEKWPEANEHFKNTDEAFDTLKARADLARKFDETQAEEKAKADAKQHTEEVQATRRWSEEEQKTLQPLQERAQKFQADANAFAAAWQKAQTRIEELEKTAPAAAQRLKAEAQAKAQELVAERDELLAAEAVTRKTLQLKDVQAEQKKLFRQVPELADETYRDELIAWAAEKSGEPEEKLRAITDPGIIVRAHRAFQEEKAAEREHDFENFMKRKARAAGVRWRDGGIGKESEFLDEVKRSGSQDAAALYLMAKRTRAREKARGRL